MAMSEPRPGPLARCGSHLITLGLPGYTLAPAVDWLLSEPAGWAEKKAYPKEVDPQEGPSHMWQAAARIRLQSWRRPCSKGASR